MDNLAEAEAGTVVVDGPQYQTALLTATLSLSLMVEDVDAVGT
jgi:hypothetical protein